MILIVGGILGLLGGAFRPIRRGPTRFLDNMTAAGQDAANAIDRGNLRNAFRATVRMARSKAAVNQQIETIKSDFDILKNSRSIISIA